MKLTSSSFQDNGALPGEFAFCVIDAKTQMTMSKNRNPQLAWSEVPAGTKSFALICHDYNVRSVADDVNQEGRSTAATLRRDDFYHCLPVDLPATVSSIAAGGFSDGITPRGKPGPAGPQGTRQGNNDYTWWFSTDKDMAGNYFGYDGCCPPCNDSILHH